MFFPLYFDYQYYIPLGVHEINASILTTHRGIKQMETHKTFILFSNRVIYCKIFYHFNLILSDISLKILGMIVPEMCCK